ncbi:MAG: DNA-directed RNA polymerase subunit N [archaeon]
MIIPVRCFTCGKTLGSEYEQFKLLLEQGKTPKEAMDAVEVERYCCRRMILSQVDLLDEVAEFRV